MFRYHAPNAGSSRAGTAASSHRGPEPSIAKSDDSRSELQPSLCWAFLGSIAPLYKGHGNRYHETPPIVDAPQQRTANAQRTNTPPSSGLRFTRMPPRKQYTMPYR